MIDFWKDKRVLLTGGGGFLGAAVRRVLTERGLPAEAVMVPRSQEHDLRQKDVAAKIARGRDIVIHLAATVGGIAFNKEHPAEVFYDNAAMALHLIDASWRAGAKKFVGVGSVVAHPTDAPMPLREGNVWQGYPDPVNAAYALAKRFMLAQSQFYRAQYGFNAIHLMPVKIYGPGMHFDPQFGQVIPMLIGKVEDAKREGRKNIEVWGSGNATREFLYVDDAAEAVVLAAERYDGSEPVHIGSGVETPIRDLATSLCRLMRYDGGIIWDSTKPEGSLRSVADVSKAAAAFGFTASTSLEEGLSKTLDWFYRYKK